MSNHNLNALNCWKAKIIFIIMLIGSQTIMGGSETIIRYPIKQGKGIVQTTNSIEAVKTVASKKLPRVPIFKKTIRKSLKVGFTLDNWNKDLIPLFTQATKITVNSTTTKLSSGTDEAATEYRALRFATTLEDGSIYSLTIPKAELSQDGEQSIGGEENAVFPLSAEAIYNPSANATGSLYYELYESAGVSATADTPPGYN